MPISDFDDLPQRAASMHSHDRTLLSSLGFSDPDKRNPEHDIVCRYLSQPDVAKKVCEWVSSRVDPKPRDSDLRDISNFGFDCDAKFVKFLPEKSLVAVTPEFHLLKGGGNYVSTVGFLDLVFEFSRMGVWEAFQKFVRSGLTYEAIPTSGQCSLYEKPFKLFVEVKASPISCGDLLRQLNLYRSYFAHTGVVAATYDISQSDAAALRESGFFFLRVGDAYKKWYEAESAKKHVSDLEV